MSETETKLEVRPALEIQAAHDRLVAVILGEVPNPFQKRESITILRASAAVLCWVLRHDHNREFGDTLQFIDSRLRAMGFEVVDSGELSPRGGLNLAQQSISAEALAEKWNRTFKVGKMVRYWPGADEREGMGHLGLTLTPAAVFAGVALIWIEDVGCVLLRNVDPSPQISEDASDVSVKGFDKMAEELRAARRERGK